MLPTNNKLNTSACDHATINDVLLAALTNALRKYLDQHDDLSVADLLTSVPVSLRPADPDLPKELVDEITPYFETAVKQGMFAEDGGGLPAALGDFDFLVASGGLTGPASELNPDNFWNFNLLEKARAALN